MPEWEVKENEWDDDRKTDISNVRAHTKGGRTVLTTVNDNHL